MNNDLTARLSTASSDLTQRALQIGQSGPERDTALMMQGLATAIEAIRELAATAERLDGLSGLGKSGE